MDNFDRLKERSNDLQILDNVELSQLSEDLCNELHEISANKSDFYCLQNNGLYEFETERFDELSQVLKLVEAEMVKRKIDFDSFFPQLDEESLNKTLAKKVVARIAGDLMSDQDTSEFFLSLSKTSKLNLLERWANLAFEVIETDLID